MLVFLTWFFRVSEGWADPSWETRHLPAGRLLTIVSYRPYTLLPLSPLIPPITFVMDMTKAEYDAPTNGCHVFYHLCYGYDKSPSVTE